MVFIFLMESWARFLPTFRFWRNEIHKSFLDISPKAGLQLNSSPSRIWSRQCITLGKNSTEFSEIFKVNSSFLLAMPIYTPSGCLRIFIGLGPREMFFFLHLNFQPILPKMQMYYGCVIAQQKSHTTKIFKKF